MNVMAVRDLTAHSTSVSELSRCLLGDDCSPIAYLTNLTIEVKILSTGHGFCRPEIQKK